MNDAPDWQHVINTEISAMSDAPDWQDVAVQPGGTPITVGGGGSLLTPYAAGGVLLITVDPVAASGALGHLIGAVYLRRCTALESGSQGHIWCFVENTGSAFTTDENYMGIYDTGQATAGTATLLGTTPAGACDVPFDTLGAQKIALVSPVTVTAGEDYFLALLNNGASGAFFGVYGATVTVNVPGFAAYPITAETSATNYTTLPATLAFSALVANGGGFCLMTST